MTQSKSNNPEYKRVFYGQHEPIFQILPDRVRDNFRSPASENALLWNTFYPRRMALELSSLYDLVPLWGTKLQLEPETLQPYFWGVNVDGERLDHLDDVLEVVDGPGQKTEVDLFLSGTTSLIAVEAKNRSGLGRCSRYIQQRCPEIHGDRGGEQACIYWEPEAVPFSSQLDFGLRPQPECENPPCARYYQLARTLLVVTRLAEVLGVQPYLWLVAAEANWPTLRRDWTNFSEYIMNAELWRSARVLSWKAIRQVPSD
ncbi:MAG: hypothetical protein JXA25_11100 [Anaerolineales bacterium]|nr:hypothetical protein [Anaerolineales bacterium]